MNELTPGQRRSLRARAHHLQPVVIVGEAGLTPAVVHEIEVALKAHELIKLKVQESDRRSRAALATSVCSALDASFVQQIGKILVVYRPRPEGETPPASREAGARRKPLRRTKRSYQMG